jgi:hypothetical protein
MIINRLESACFLGQREILSPKQNNFNYKLVLIHLLHVFVYFWVIKQYNYLLWSANDWFRKFQNIIELETFVVGEIS